jgi:signal transduction histidine kinase
VEDNGCGIIEEKINWSNSLGILGMKERAYSFNGSVDFKNSRTGGTRVISRFPEIAVFHPKE